MIDKKTFAFGFIAVFIWMTWYLFKNNDSIAQIIAKNGLQGIFWYFISNLGYVFIFVSIFFLNRESSFIKNAIGGLLLILAIDIVSFPRFSPTTLTTDMMLLASSDGILLHKLMGFGMQYPTAYFTYYFVLPIILVIGSISILGFTDFFRRLIHA